MYTPSYVRQIASQPQGCDCACAVAQFGSCVHGGTFALAGEEEGYYERGQWTIYPKDLEEKGGLLDKEDSNIV